MFPSEVLHDIIEDSTSELADDIYFQDDGLEEEDEEEVDPQQVADEIAVDDPDRTKTSKSKDSQAIKDRKSVRGPRTRPRKYGYSASNLTRDHTIDLIIQSRNSGVIENDYTILSQTTSHHRRTSPRVRIQSVKTRAMTILTEADLRGNEAKDQVNNAQPGKNTPAPPKIQFDNDQWDDGLNTDFDRESIASIDKSSLQVYEERCKRLNICPCSMVVRSLHTTKINLENYGLGPKGSAALAVALIRNTTVVTLNLSGNNIGNGGMSHIYHVITDNSYIEEYDLSFNNLGTKGCAKLAAAIASNSHLKMLSIAGNGLTGNDINQFLSKIEEHPNLRNFNLSHNQLGEDGGKYVAKWLGENSVLTHLNISWCSIRLSGALALAKVVGDNNKLISLDLSNNSFGNDTVDALTNSLARNMSLDMLDLSENQIFCRYDTKTKEDPSILIIGKESLVYKLFAAAATNQALKIFRIGKNHLDARCLMIILEALSKLENISLEELDLTSSSFNLKQVFEIHRLFEHHPKFACYVGPLRQSVEHFANNMLNSIHKHCVENQITLASLFELNDEDILPSTTITYDEFRDALRKAKIPFPVAQIENIMKYLGQEEEEGTIAFSAIQME